jgi:hypothetical protein
MLSSDLSDFMKILQITVRGTITIICTIFIECLSFPIVPYLFNHKPIKIPPELIFPPLEKP